MQPESVLRVQTNCANAESADEIAGRDEGAGVRW